MKLWKAFLLVIILFLVGAFLSSAGVPRGAIDLIWTVIIIGTTIWVYKDSKKLQVEKYKSSLAMKPLFLAIWVVIIWGVSFPFYLNLRYKIKNNLIPLKDKYQNPQTS